MRLAGGCDHTECCDSKAFVLPFGCRETLECGVKRAADMGETITLTEALAPPSEWHASVSAGGVWTLGNLAAQSESKPRHVTRQCGLRGIAKEAIQAGGGTPRAAHEKISADIAQMLGVPVPPVILWTDPLTGDQYSISAWAYKQVMTWDAMVPVMSQEFRDNVAQVVADGIVFHTFIGDTDRHGGNTLINADCSAAFPEICFIDHAFALSHNPAFINGNLGRVAHNYVPPGLTPDAMLALMAKKVESLPANRVADTVRRIPASFLPVDRADVIIRQLLQRQAGISRLLGI